MLISVGSVWVVKVFLSFFFLAIIIFQTDYSFFLMVIYLILREHICMHTWMGEGQREGERENPKQALCCQHGHLRTVRSWPELKSRVRRLTDWASQVPSNWVFFWWLRIHTLHLQRLTLPPCRQWSSVGLYAFSVCLLQPIEHRQACITRLFPKIMSYSHHTLRLRGLFGVHFLYVNLRVKLFLMWDIYCTCWTRPSRGKALSYWPLEVTRLAMPHN